MALDHLCRTLGGPSVGAYLEIHQPDLPSVLEQHVLHHRNFTLKPLLLFRGGHALRDIPEIVDAFLDQHPEANIEVEDVLGVPEQALETWMNTMVGERQREVILLGRGAKDKEAIEAFDSLVNQMESQSGRRVHVAYTAFQSPDLPTLLETLGGPLLMLPCLLFDGLLLDRAREQLASRDAIVAPTVGQHLLVPG